MDDKISFTCTCGCEFIYSLQGKKVFEYPICDQNDPECSCRGYGYSATCPECGDSCEGEY